MGSGSMSCHPGAANADPGFLYNGLGHWCSRLYTCRKKKLINHSPFCIQITLLKSNQVSEKGPGALRFRAQALKTEFLDLNSGTLILNWLYNFYNHFVIYCASVSLSLQGENYSTCSCKTL